MKTRIGTVTAMTLCMGVAPLAFTLIIVKLSAELTADWSSEEFGIVFALLHFSLFAAGAYVYARWIGD